ncbi:Calpain-type cysteine protease DEK1 [Capsicum baccatum]|uniref:Calpain-type cysteine protease DEK1 n=1 Tax=Capsicum baccatum TaxID=33114 RepID=A0A2G2VIU2_CAPBA|nr:Calpain-type cysteine protease DEK1 [Capsicum baccatum]
MLKRKGRNTDRELSNLLQDKGLDPNFAVMLKKNVLDPMILALLQRSSLDADRAHLESNRPVTDSNDVEDVLPNHISFSEELRLQGLGKWLQRRRVMLHHVAGTPERAWLLFSLIFILETVVVAIFRPKTIKLFNATHQQVDARRRRLSVRAHHLKQCLPTWEFDTRLSDLMYLTLCRSQIGTMAEDLSMTSKPRKCSTIKVEIHFSIILFEGSLTCCLLALDAQCFYYQFLGKSFYIVAVWLYRFDAEHLCWSAVFILSWLNPQGNMICSWLYLLVDTSVVHIGFATNHQFWSSRAKNAGRAGNHLTLGMKEGVILFISISLFAGSILALGAIVSAKPLDDLDYKGWIGGGNSVTSPYASFLFLGWAMASAIALVVTAVLPIISWFATYRFSLSSAICIGIFADSNKSRFPCFFASIDMNSSSIVSRCWFVQVVLLSPSIVVYSPRVLPCLFMFTMLMRTVGKMSALAIEGWGVVASLQIYPPFAGAAVSAITLVVAFVFAVSRPCLTLEMVEEAVHFLSKETMVQAIARSATKTRNTLSGTYSAPQRLASSAALLVGDSTMMRDRGGSFVLPRADVMKLRDRLRNEELAAGSIFSRLRNRTLRHEATSDVGFSDLSAEDIKKWLPEDRRRFKIIQESYMKEKEMEDEILMQRREEEGRGKKRRKALLEKEEHKWKEIEASLISSIPNAGNREAAATSAAVRAVGGDSVLDDSFARERVSSIARRMRAAQLSHRALQTGLTGAVCILDDAPTTSGK